MTPFRMVVGGDPSPSELAALAAAVTHVLSAVAPAEAGPPAAYRSPWRRAAIAESIMRLPEPGTRNATWSP